MSASRRHEADELRGLLGVAEVSDVSLSSARDRFVARADRDDLLDVTYRTMESPAGVLLLAATPLGVVRVAFASDGHEAVLERLALLVSPRIVAAPGRLDALARELDEYFAGERRGFDVPLDFRLSRGFRRTVLRHMAEIPYGETESYSELAAAAGNPRAVRAVGTACATNPLPLVVPCHRVVRSDGTIGNYGGGTEVKRALLELESRG